jgi:hypothetical protein
VILEEVDRRREPLAVRPLLQRLRDRAERLAVLARTSAPSRIPSSKPLPASIQPATGRFVDLGAGAGFFLILVAARAFALIFAMVDPATTLPTDETVKQW